MRTESPQETDWHPEDVKAAIRKTGVSLSALAVQHGKSISAIRMTLRRPSAHVQEIIGRHLGLAPQSIWPSRYDQMGLPIDRRRSSVTIHTPRDAAKQRQNRRAE